MTAKRLRIFALMLVCLWTATLVFSQSHVAAAAPVVAAKAEKSIEDESLRASDAETKPAVLRSGESPAGASSASDLSRIVFALAVVIGLILLLRALSRKLTSPTGIGKPGKLVTVLSRSMISPRQQILVLQVGNRLLVVGDSGGAMNQLCELTDPDEIAQIIGQTRAKDTAGDRKQGSFGNLFRKATEPFADAQTTGDIASEPTSDDPPAEPVTVEEVGGLLDKIRLLQQQYKLKA